MRECAYCGQLAPETGEHIISRCLIDHSETEGLFHPRAGDKTINPHQKINDVCKICNNEKLSDTDDEICRLYERYFNDWVGKNENVKFIYDFNRLSRWLLKTFFNGIRAGADVSKYKKLEGMKEYMIGDRPPKYFFSVFLLLIHPVDIDSKEYTVKVEGNSEFVEDGLFKPNVIQLGVYNFSEDLYGDFEGYIFVANSYVFFTFIHSESRFASKREIQDIKGKLKGVRKINRQDKITVNTSLNFAEAGRMFGIFQK